MSNKFEGSRELGEGRSTTDMPPYLTRHGIVFDLDSLERESVRILAQRHNQQLSEIVRSGGDASQWIRGREDALRAYGASFSNPEQIDQFLRFYLEESRKAQEQELERTQRRVNLLQTAAKGCAPVVAVAALIPPAAIAIWAMI